MADSLLTVVQRVSRRVGLDPTITAFSDNDETNDVVLDVNDAYEHLLNALPDDTPYLIDVTGSLSLVNGTRAYSLDSAARSFKLLEWSFENETDDDSKIRPATLEYVQRLDSKYDETTAQPTHVYLEGSDQVGFYPVPDASYTIKYKFAKSFTRLSATTDTFVVPDEWLPYIELYAQALYEKRKGFGNYAETFELAERKLTDIFTDVETMTPHYFDPGSYV